MKVSSWDNHGNIIFLERFPAGKIIEVNGGLPSNVWWTWRVPLSLLSENSMKAWIPVLMCGNVCWRLGQSLIPFAHCRTFQPQNPIRWSSLATTGCSWAGFHHMTSGIGDGYPGIASPQLLPPLFSGFPVVCVVVVHVNLHQPPVTLSSAMQALRGGGRITSDCVWLVTV